jgi:ATP-dependent Lon protease
MLPEIIRQSGIPQESLIIEDESWAKIVRPLGFDAGMRTLERTIQQVVRKAAREIVAGKTKTFVVTPDNVKEFLQYNI